MLPLHFNFEKITLIKSKNSGVKHLGHKILEIDIYQYCLFLIVKTRTAIPTLSSSGNNGLKDCLFT